MADVWNAVVNFFVASVLMGTTLMYGTLGEIITEKSGNINLGVEGLVYMGGAAGIIAPFIYEQAMGGQRGSRGGNADRSGSWVSSGRFWQSDFLVSDHHIACQSKCNWPGAEHFWSRIRQVLWRVFQSKSGRGVW